MDRTYIEATVRYLLAGSVGKDYAEEFVANEEFMQQVWEDVEAASALRPLGRFNDDDVRLALGRVLLYRLGIMY